MRSFERDLHLVQAVPAPVARALADVDRGRGSEGLHLAQAPGLLHQLAARARVSSVMTSSALEGVTVPQPRADGILARSTSRLRTRDEQELAGLRDALDHVWQQDWAPLNTGFVLHLHRLLLGHTEAGGGRFKGSDNLVVDRAPDGTRTVRFRPVCATETPAAVDDLVARFDHHRRADVHHPVLLVGLLVLDLLVVHPFEDGNGRVARVVTNAALADAGYRVARYVSLEQLVAESAEEYYAALLASTHGWHAGEHDPWPWLSYLVRQLQSAYDRFAAGTAAGSTTGKRQRVVEHVLQRAPEVFRLADLRAALPGLSDGTMRNALDDLRRDGRVVSEGAGRGATWRRLR